MTISVKAGYFSDGGHRFRVVAPGFDADPAPTDPTNIIFDSDWPELLSTAAGYYGTAVLSPTAITTVSFPTLPFLPFVAGAFYVPDLPAYSSSHPLPYNYYGTTLWEDLQTAYQLSSGFAVSESSMSLPAMGNVSTGLWAVFFADPTALAGSRAGTTWMKWDASGPVVSKPGRLISSTNVWDFLIPPASLGPVLGQPLHSETVSSLGWVQNWNQYNAPGVTPTYNKVADYIYSYKHSLGYIPFVFSISYPDFRVSALASPNIYVDDQRVYVVGRGSGYSSAGKTLAIAPTSIFIMKNKWH
jgi:hypothetical protein